MFQIKNILGHTLSTIIGVVLAFAVGISLFLLVHYKYANFGEIAPILTIVLPMAISALFALYAPSNQNPNV